MYKFFEFEGFEKACQVTAKYGELKCCKEVSEAIEKLASLYKIDCKAVPVKVFSKNDFGSDHYVVLYKDKLIDYTQAQYFNSNDPKDTKCDIINKYIKNTNEIFSNDRFLTKDKHSIYYTEDSMDLAGKINSEEVIPDNKDYIIYQIYNEGGN